MNTTTTPRLDPALAAGNRKPLAAYRATHFQWEASEGVATLTLNRPERKNPLTFDSYWKIEGPTMSWYFRGSPHVHTWVHIAKA